MVSNGNHALLRYAVRRGPHGANAVCQRAERFWVVERVQWLRLHPDWKLITQLAVPPLLALRALDTFHGRGGLKTSCLATTYGCPNDRGTCRSMGRSRINRWPAVGSPLPTLQSDMTPN